MDISMNNEIDNINSREKNLLLLGTICFTLIYYIPTFFASVDERRKKKGVGFSYVLSSSYLHTLLSGGTSSYIPLYLFLYKISLSHMSLRLSLSSYLLPLSYLSLTPVRRT
jgi:hypothetical protein